MIKFTESLGNSKNTGEDYLFDLHFVKEMDHNNEPVYVDRHQAFRGVELDRLVDNNGIIQFKLKNVYLVKIGEKVKSLENFPINCKHVKISNSGITDLIGLPKSLSSLSIVDCTSLTSLIGISALIEDSLHISYCNNLTSLKHISDTVKRHINIIYTNITNLEHFPNIDKSGSININNNKLTSLVGLPKEIKNLSIEENDLKSLKGACEIVNQTLEILCDNLLSYNYFPKYFKDLANLSTDNTNITSLEDSFIYAMQFKGNIYNAFENTWKALSHKNGNFYTDYFLELFKYMKKYDKLEFITKINWEENFIDKLEDVDKNIFKNTKNIKKFNL